MKALYKIAVGKIFTSCDNHQRGMKLPLMEVSLAKNSSTIFKIRREEAVRKAMRVYLFFMQWNNT